MMRQSFTVDSKVFKAPTYTYNDVTNDNNYPSTIRGILYNGLDYNGNPTRVFAFYGVPANASPSNPVPAVVCVHGGGGTAYAQWVKQWVDRGYAAIAMDNYGNIPDNMSGTSVHHDDAGNCCPPDYSFSTIDQPQNMQWMYYAVSDAILANSLLRADSRIDRNKIGITGISWGGLITNLTICQDRRFTFAVSVYSSGYNHESYAQFHTVITPGKVAALWDASYYYKYASIPVLFINSDHDFAFSVDTTSKSALATNGKMCIHPDMQHGHEYGWAPPEIYRFADSVVNGGGGMVDITEQPNASMGRNATVKYSSIPAGLTFSNSVVYYTTSDLTYDADWNLTSTWYTLTPTVDRSNRTITAILPASAVNYYININADDGTNTYTTSTCVVKIS